MLVYVLNKHGQPLMPCKPQKARRLLQQEKAKVIHRTPFTIQLQYGSSGYKQPVSLGVDAGTKHIGLSATTGGHVLFEGEVKLRTYVLIFRSYWQLAGLCEVLDEAGRLAIVNHAFSIVRKIKGGSLHPFKTK